MEDIFSLNSPAQTALPHGTLGVAQRPHNVEGHHVEASTRQGPLAAVRRPARPSSSFTDAAFRTHGFPWRVGATAPPPLRQKGLGLRHPTRQLARPLAKAGASKRSAASPAPNPLGGLAGESEVLVRPVHLSANGRWRTNVWRANPGGPAGR